jgi:hypothetical protein
MSGGMRYNKRRRRSLYVLQDIYHFLYSLNRITKITSHKSPALNVRQLIHSAMF